MTDIDNNVILAFIVLSAVILSLHGGQRADWPWALVASAAVAFALYERHKGYHPNASKGSAANEAGFDFEERERQDRKRRQQDGISDDGLVMHPHLYSVQRLKDRDAWLRGDPGLTRALSKLRPFVPHDGHRVKVIIQTLGEFYRRYDILLNRPGMVHISNEYTILHDLHVTVLNDVHSLYFSKPMPLCRELPDVMRAVLARTSRMLRVLRHKYPSALRTVQGSAPKACDTLVGNYELFV